MLAGMSSSTSVRPLVIVRKSGRINVAAFDKAVERSVAYWQGLLTWCFGAAAMPLPVIRANGVRTLFFPQPRQDVKRCVRASKSDRPIVALPPQTPHAADTRAALLTTFEMAREFSRPEGVNVVCTQGLDGLTCTWGRLQSLCRKQRPFVMILALSLKNWFFDRIRELWTGDGEFLSNREATYLIHTV